MQLLAKQDNIDSLLRKLKSVSDALHSGSTTFECEATQPQDSLSRGSPAFTREWFAQVIHLRPLFWSNSGPQQAVTIGHELGRFYGGEWATDNSGELGDAYVWDQLVSLLSSQSAINYIQKLDGSP